MAKLTFVFREFFAMFSIIGSQVFIDFFAVLFTVVFRVCKTFFVVVFVVSPVIKTRITR